MESKVANTESWVEFDISLFSSSLLEQLSLGRSDWSERKDIGSLVGERGGRKGNQATWANTWGSTQTLCTQMWVQLREPGSRRRHCCSLISTSLFGFAFVSLFTLPLSTLLCLFCLSFILFNIFSPSPFGQLQQNKGAEKELWKQPVTNGSARLQPISGHHRWVQHTHTHPRNKQSD